jgi:hypothetical protein
MVLQKAALNLKLSGRENQLYEAYLLRQEKRTETVGFDSDGRLIIKKTLDAEPIIQAVSMSSEIETPSRNNRGMLHLGSIDRLTAANWARECGAAIGTKEFAAYAKKKLQSGDFAKFAVKRKKRYV